MSVNRQGRAHPVILSRPVVGRRILRDGGDFVSLSRLFGPEFLAKKAGEDMGIANIAGDPSANKGPQDYSH